MKVHSLLKKGVRNFAINLKEVDYIYSDTINKFINLNHQILKVYGRLALLSPGEEVGLILKRAGIENFVKIYPSEEELLRASEEIVQQTAAIGNNENGTINLDPNPPVSEFEDFREEIGKAFESPGTTKGFSQPSTPGTFEPKSFPSPAQESIKEQNQISGHLHIDKVTSEDLLGYDLYAHTIYRFLVHPQTKTPLTISIQAPWGGGKSSLMHMIQKKIDSFKNENSKKNEPGLSLKGQRKFVNEYIHGGSYVPKLESLSKRESKICTIWFNPWKYQSKEQIWAGLVNSIVEGYAKKLTRIEEEKFYLYLHLKRLDLHRLRKMVYNQAIHTFIKLIKKGGWFLLALATSLFALLYLSIENIVPLKIALPSGVSISLLYLILNYVKKSRKSNQSNSFSNFIKAPDYSKKEGFIAEAEKDVDEIIETIEADKILIFIDDLDRCSPENVSEVFEALNLFLAGEMDKCMFIIGMDSEIVAASLLVAHEKIIDKLSIHSEDTHLGWKFMDKFIQLPFIIPPIQDRNIEKYAQSLLSTKLINRIPVSKEVQSELSNIAINPFTTNQEKELDKQLDSLAKKHKYSKEDISALHYKHYSNKIMSNIDKRIDDYSDTDSPLKKALLSFTKDFSTNPREIKRFINMFRFMYFIKLGYSERSDGVAPENEQILRWIKLSIRWPSIIQWLFRVENLLKNRQLQFTQTGNALNLLETAATKAKEVKKWQELIAQELNLSYESLPFLNNNDLYQFFKEEGTLPVDKRLSHGSGKGIW